MFEVNSLTYTFLNDTKNDDGQTYEAWVEYMGGGTNLILRELIRDKKLA